MAASAGAAIGRGELVSGGAFAGVITSAESVAEVLALLDTDLSEAVLLTEQASATAFAPILPQIRGVICTRGGASAHLAIVSRGLGLPCVMQASLERRPAFGEWVAVDEDGGIRAP